jgi:hypothetical protein
MFVGALQNSVGVLFGVDSICKGIAHLSVDTLFDRALPNSTTALICRHIVDLASGVTALCGLAALSTCAQYTYGCPSRDYQLLLQQQLQLNAQRVVFERMRFRPVSWLLRDALQARSTRSSPTSAKSEVVIERTSAKEGSVQIQEAIALAGLLLGGAGVIILMSDDGSHERWLQCGSCQPERIIGQNPFFICAVL